MTTSKSIKKLAADANVILSAIAGKAALRIFLIEDISFVTTALNIDEVSEYAGIMGEKYGLPEKILQSQLKLLPLTVYDRGFYEDFLQAATIKLNEKDPDDIELLALALKLKIPVWSNDKDFRQTGVDIYNTARLLKILNV